MADLAGWLEEKLGHRPADLALFERALTHSSRGEDNYERLEFLGDRVLGLVIADWLYGLVPGRARGQAVAAAQRPGLARHLRRGRRASSVSPPQMRLGKQARDDGAFESDNVLGDMVEALIGALWLDGGLRGGAALHPRRLGGPGRPPRRRAPASQVGASGMGGGATTASRPPMK